MPLTNNNLAFGISAGRPHSKTVKEDKSDNIIIYMDSCNGKSNIRGKFIEDISPDKVIFINFK